MTENRAGETGAEAIFSNALITELIRSGVSISHEGKADAVIEGVIESVNTRTLSRRSSRVSKERRIEMTLSFKLIKREGNVLLSSGRLSVDGVYLADDNRSDRDAARLNAIRQISQEAAEQVYYRLCENF